MNPLKFAELKPKIEQALNQRLALSTGPKDPQGFTLIDGFFTQPIQTELSANFTIGGPSITLVAIVGNSTGVTHYFALKALLPNETAAL